MPVSIQDGTGSGNFARVDSNNRLYVDSNISYLGSVVGVTANDGSTCLNTITPDIYTTASLTTTNTSLVIDCMGQTSAVFEVLGTWQGKIYAEGSIDGTTWVNLSLVQPTGNFIRTGIMNDSQNGVYRIALVSAYRQLRIIRSPATSGTANIAINLSNSVGTTYVWQLNQANLLTTAYQGGSWVNTETIPTATQNQNFKTVLVYSGNSIGSIYKCNSAGSYVKVLSYTGENLTNVSSWAVA
jgi:hypothetical protein